jgi:hypothetical protein
MLQYVYSVQGNFDVDECLRSVKKNHFLEQNSFLKHTSLCRINIKQQNFPPARKQKYVFDEMDR